MTKWESEQRRTVKKMDKNMQMGFSPPTPEFLATSVYVGMQACTSEHDYKITTTVHTNMAAAEKFTTKK